MLPEFFDMKVVILDEGDQKFVKECMEGMTVGGGIILPSGTRVNKPPEGYDWYISGGEIRTKRKSNGMG